MRYFNFLVLTLGVVTAEDGSLAWLRYAPVPSNKTINFLPSTILVLNSSTGSPVYTAGQELRKGINGIFGKQLGINGTTEASSSIIIGTAGTYQRLYGSLGEIDGLKEDGFFLSNEGSNVLIIGQNERGVLYGAFEYLSRVAQGNLTPVSFVSNPHASIRW
jgi:alpha-glucuronidase